MKTLSLDQMNDVANSFKVALENALSGLVGESKTSASGFIASIALHQQAHMVVSPEGLKQIIAIVFSDAGNRDFIFNLSFRFFAGWSGNEAEIDGLAASLASGCSQTHYIGDYSGVPIELSARLPGQADIEQLLRSNKWLMIIILLLLYVVIDK
jgi:hypothetical protein